MADPTRGTTEPRTEAGRRLVAMLPDYGYGAKTNRWRDHLEKYVEAILAIEDQAAVLPGITREQLITVVGSALYGWADDEPNEATGHTARFEVKKVTDAILAAIERGEPQEERT